MAVGSWWARQRGKSDTGLKAPRAQLRRRLEHKKHPPSWLTRMYRHHRTAWVLLGLIALGIDYFIGGIWLLLAVVIALPVLMVFGYRYRARLRQEGWNI